MKLLKKFLNNKENYFTLKKFKIKIILIKTNLLEQALSFPKFFNTYAVLEMNL